MYSWTQYNEKLVRRGEILISGECLKNWDKELAAMNQKKEDRRFLFPESFMKVAGYAKAYFGLPYRQTEAFLGHMVVPYRTYQIIPRYTKGSINWISRSIPTLVTMTL
ncbi:MAG: transposase [Thaumarchaeota archaeon]|nr:transposase [Nitrososphaerota archaeon]